MNRSFLYVVNFIFILILFLFKQNLYADEAAHFDCYSIIVGKEASISGSVLMAHNEDDRGPQIMNVYKVPQETHTTGDSIRLQNGGVIAQTPKTNGFIWIQLPGMAVADAFVNEHGVVIASDGCPSREDNPDLTDGGIVYWLRRLAAERAETARQGVKLAGRLIEQFGYASSGRTYVIADSKEGWMLAVVNGKHWVARRVPDDQVAVIPNYYTIGEINLADTTQFLGSKDIVEYAVKRSWYDPEKEGNFHFARAYTAERSIDHPGNIRRMMRGVNLLSGKQYKEDDNLPFSFKPEKKISISDIKAVLRDHYEGTELDKTDHYALGNPHEIDETTICDYNTQFSMIVHLRDDLPAELSTVLWLAPHRPCVQAYTPWYPGIRSIPEGYAYTDYETAIKEHFDPPESIFEANETHHYWKFVNRVKRIDKNYKQNIKSAKTRYTEIEESIAAEQPDFEKKVLKIYQSDPDKARQMLTEFSAKWAVEVLK